MPPPPLARHTPLDSWQVLLCRSTPPEPGVDPLLHDIARSEHQHAPRRDRHLLPRLGVATHALSLLADVERSERGKFDRFSVCQLFRKHLYDQFHQFLRLVARQSDLQDDRLREIRARERFATHDFTTPPLPALAVLLAVAPPRVNNNSLKLHT